MHSPHQVRSQGGAGARAAMLAAFTLCWAAWPASFAASAGVARAGAAHATAAEKLRRAARFDGYWIKEKLDFTFADDEPLRPAAVAERAALKPQDDPRESCIPAGLGSMMVFGAKTEIMAVNDEILMLSEDNNIRRIRLDTTQHDPDPVLSFYGDTVVHWEGNTMVIDSTGFNGVNMLDGHGGRMTDTMHIIERWRLQDRNHIDMWFTIEDPQTYTQPWNSKHFIWTRLRETPHFPEAFCEENNRLDPKNPKNMQDFTTSDQPIGLPPTRSSFGFGPKSAAPAAQPKAAPASAAPASAAPASAAPEKKP